MAALTVAAAIAGGCKSLPEIERPHRNPDAVQFEGSRGPLSREQSSAILEKLKAESGESSLLDRHVALEQSLVDSPLVVGNHVTLLKDGPATYRAMFEAIGKARQTINLETYIFEDDEIGQKFADLLIARQKAGVQVAIIYDSIGAINSPDEFFERLKASGIRTLEFNPINPLEGKNKSSPGHRNHRKLLIVDGRTAFLGGINISRVYSSGSAPSGGSRPKAKAQEDGKKKPAEEVPWRDTHVQIDGPVVAEYQKLFLETWRNQSEEPLDGAHYFPKLQSAGKDIVRAVGSNAKEPYSQIYVTLISAINSAEKSIYLTNAYFVPDPQLLESLRAAARRGVDVKIILPSQTDFWAVFHAGRSHYAPLLEAGVQIYERQNALLHSKTAIIDGVWSCVGSTNLDWRSFVHNNELDAVILGEDFADELHAMFVDDLKQSKRIDARTWSKRPLNVRMKEWVARMWSYWL